jgi:lipopolysaccharide export system permease protein
MLLRISDRYIIRSFLVSFAICFLALVSLFVVIDTFNNLNNLTNHLTVEARAAGAAPGAARRAGGQFLQVVTMILRMNAVRMPLIFYILAPVLTLSAAMFTIVRLKRANEITPLLAAGVSIYRVVWPIFLMAIVLTIAQVVDREIVIPRLGQDLREWDVIRKESTNRFMDRTMIEDGYGNIIFAAKYELASKTQISAQITRYWQSGPVRTPMVVVNASSAVWQAKPAGWLFKAGTAIKYDSFGALLPQVRFGDEGFFVPLSTGDGQPPDYAIVTDVTPTRLQAESDDIFYRPTLDLLQYAHDHGLRGDVALDLNKRIAAPLGNAILLLLGLPFVLKRNVKSPFLAIIMAVAITGLYFALGLITENFAMEQRFLTPLTGAWAPIIIFGPIGVLIFDTVES